MNEQYNAKLTTNARKLRKSMTKEERHLWYDCLKQLPVTVHRQKILGNYIVDFYIASAKIVIELDGSQHYEEAHQRKDALRDAYLKDIGCNVLRYSNSDINLRFRDVCEDIFNHIGEAVTNSPQDFAK
ncbi:MAG: endonuclease domain-containing protein [Oscillospiraceae bacterium]|nr:endonuclease domain-containing protein [Oscillospiraceae bacterium]